MLFPNIGNNIYVTDQAKEHQIIKLYQINHSNYFHTFVFGYHRYIKNANLASLYIGTLQEEKHTK
jgi:hypothetical protein